MLTEDLHRHRDLAADVGVAFICAIVCLAVHVIAVRAVFAVPIALMAPGYAVMAAIFARVPLEVHSRLMLIPALSIVSLVIGALVLNLMPWGLRPLSWAIWLVLVVVVASAVAYQRRGPGPTSPGPTLPLPLPHLRPRPATVIVGLLAACVAAAAMVASRIPLAAHNVAGYARLSLTPTANRRAIVVSTLNGYEHGASFNLVVTVNFNQVLSRTVRLAPGRSQAVELALGTSSQTRQISATLTQPGAGKPARTVNLSLPGA